MYFRRMPDSWRTRFQREGRKGKSSVFLLFLISYIIMLAISMLSNIVYYARMENKMLENVRRTSFAMLKQMKIDIDNRLEVVNYISNKLVFNKKVEMMLKGSYSLYSYKDIMDDMMAQPKYDFIYDYYLFDKGNNEIITSTIRLGSEQFYRTMYSYPGLDYDAWNEILSQYHFKTYLSGRKLNAYAGMEEHEVITFIQSIPINTGENFLGQAVILLDQSKINETVDKINWATEGYVYLMDKSGNLITTSKGAPGLSGDIKEQMGPSADIIHYTKGKNDAVILYDTSEDTGWKYVIVMPQSAYLADINRDKIFTFVLLISCFLLGMILSYAFAYHNYLPIREIKDMVTKKINIENPHYKNEFDYIRSSILNVFNDHNRLSSRITEHLPTMRSDYLIKLLKGYGKPSDIDGETLKFMNIDIVSDDFVVAVAKINGSSSFFESDNEKEWALARFVIQNVGSEILKKDGPQYFVEMESDMLACIINFAPDRSSALLQSKIKNDIAELGKALSELCELNVAFGVSDVHSRIVELRECYDEAVKALNYALLIGMQDIMFFNELAVKHDYYYYPIEMEVRLMNLLRAGDDANAEEIIHTLFEINFESRETSLDAGHYFIMDLLATLMKVMNTMRAKNEEAFLRTDSLMDIAAKDKSIDTIREEVSRLAYEICSFVKKQYVSPSEKLIREVEGYIKTNYCENWMSLSAIADRFGVTPQYLSNLFKQHRGENITDFISRLKVKKAKELLVSTDLTIAEISCKLGYANEMGITRIFKKQEGITPGAYREQAKA